MSEFLCHGIAGIGHHRGKVSIGSQQVRGWTIFQHFPVPQHKDVVVFDDRIQTVRYGQYGAVRKCFLQGFLQQLIGPTIDGRRRFVEDKDGIARQQGTRQTQQLSLSDREVVAVLTHEAIPTIRDLLDDIPQMTILQYLPDVVLRKQSEGIQIFTDRTSTEQGRNLRQDAHACAKGVQAHGGDVDAVH